MTPSPFTAALRAAIVASGESYLAIERATGVHRASVSRFVAGTRSLHLDVADKLAAYLGLEVRAAAKPRKG